MYVHDNNNNNNSCGRVQYRFVYRIIIWVIVPYELYFNSLKMFINYTVYEPIKPGVVGL